MSRAYVTPEDISQLCDVIAKLRDRNKALYGALEAIFYAAEDRLYGVDYHVPRQAIEQARAALDAVRKEN